jgi:hypothetical protein
MKKPPAEITNEKAKFLLCAYRPNGADAQDEIFRDALNHAARDPELAAWFKEQREFDSVIAGKLEEITPPAGLKSAILAGLETQPVAKRHRYRPLLAIAALAVLSGMVLYPMYLRDWNNQARFSGYQQAALAIVTSHMGPGLDMKTPDFCLTQDFIEENRGPCAPELPVRFRDLNTAGCKIFQWNGHPVSLTCFRLPSGELLHLFVTDGKMFANQNMPIGFMQKEGWYVKIQRIKGMVMMFVSRATMKEIEQFI